MFSSKTGKKLYWKIIIPDDISKYKYSYAAFILQFARMLVKIITNKR